MVMKKILSVLVMFLITAVVYGASMCEAAEEKKDVTVGVTSISEVTYNAIKKHYEAMGYKVKFISFDSNPVILEACNNGEVDIALGQHLKFVRSFNQSRGGDLTMAKPYGYYTGIGLYSEKYKSIEDIPVGAQIAIMNDSMNMDIALRILESCGFIKLDPSIDVCTVADVIENPHKIKIVDMDQAQTVVAMQDMDAACVFFTHMSNAGKDPGAYLARDTQMINYPMGVIVKEKNADSKWATDYAKCFKIQEVRDEINKAFPNVFKFYENDSQVKE